MSWFRISPITAFIIHFLAERLPNNPDAMPIISKDIENIMNNVLLIEWTMYTASLSKAHKDVAGKM